MRAVDLIAKKRDGFEHTPEEIEAIVRSVVDGSMPDYQTAAWLMAVCLRGMTERETLDFTLAMSGSSTSRLAGVTARTIPRLDKHSTGGVGDKTSLVVVPLLAAAGVPILKMSGRGLGYSGGTIDKLESIPGFRTNLTRDEAEAQVERIGAAIICQSQDLVSADSKLYALRDVTATVESIPLIASSIMSKKLAAGADVVLLDVKVGRGAFMKTVDRARELAQMMIGIGRGAGVRTVALLTAMDEPLGCAVGNALEVAEACAMLSGAGPTDPRFSELCLALAARGLVMAGAAENEVTARTRLEALLRSGAAAAKLAEMIEAQAGDARVVQDPGLLPLAPVRFEVASASGGFVVGIDGEAVGRLAVELGAGRATKGDVIDPAVGIVVRKRTGDAVAPGEPLAVLHLRSDAPIEHLARRTRESVTIGDAHLQQTPAILGVVD